MTVLKNALEIANTGKVVPEIGGVTGEIIVENLNAGYYILGGAQYFEYKMSHHLGKRAESSFNRVSCLAGTFPPLCFIYFLLLPSFLVSHSQL